MEYEITGKEFANFSKKLKQLAKEEVDIFLSKRAAQTLLTGYHNKESTPPVGFETSLESLE